MSPPPLQQGGVYRGAHLDVVEENQDIKDPPGCSRCMSAPVRGRPRGGLCWTVTWTLAASLCPVFLKWGPGGSTWLQAGNPVSFSTLPLQGSCRQCHFVRASAGGGAYPCLHQILAKKPAIPQTFEMWSMASYGRRDKIGSSSTHCSYFQCQEPITFQDFCIVVLNASRVQ